MKKMRRLAKGLTPEAPAVLAIVCNMTGGSHRQLPGLVDALIAETYCSLHPAGFQGVGSVRGVGAEVLSEISEELP